MGKQSTISLMKGRPMIIRAPALVRGPAVCRVEAAEISTPCASTWLLKNSPMIVDGFARCSQEVRARIDPDLDAISWADFKERP